MAAGRRAGRPGRVLVLPLAAVGTRSTRSEATIFIVGEELTAQRCPVLRPQTCVRGTARAMRRLCGSSRVDSLAVVACLATMLCLATVTCLGGSSEALSQHAGSVDTPTRPVLVVGATGRTGSRTYLLLKRNGVPVRGLASRTANPNANANPNPNPNPDPNPASNPAGARPRAEQKQGTAGAGLRAMRRRGGHLRRRCDRPRDARGAKQRCAAATTLTPTPSPINPIPNPSPTASLQARGLSSSRRGHGWPATPTQRTAAVSRASVL